MINNRRLLLGGSSELVLTADKTTVKASADTVTLTTKYGSSDVSTQATYTVSYSGSSSTNQNKVSFTSLGTTATSQQTITIQAKLNGILSNIVTLTRQANTSTTSYSYSIDAYCDDIPASGGYSDNEITVKYNTTPYYSWTSGSTSTGSTSSSWVSGYTTSQNIHGSDLGTTPKSRTKLGTVTVTYSGKTDTVDVYQEANSVTRRTYEFDIYSLSYNDIDASGGYAYPSYSLSYDTYAYYTSGSSEMESTVPLSESQCSLRWSGTHVNSSTGAAGSASSLGTTVKSRTLYTTATVSGSYNGYTDSASCSVYQEANRVERTSTSEGGTTYGDITEYSTTYAVIPASGGTGTATASTAKQSYTTSGTVTTYYYTSGATDSETTGSSSSGSLNVSPSVASITATASSRGTTVDGQITIKSQQVTWSSHGKSVSDTMYIYQAENIVVDTTRSGGTTTYGELTGCTVKNATIPASGGTGTATASTGKQTITTSAGTTTYTYSSGEKKTVTTGSGYSETIDVKPDHDSISFTASSKGSTVSGIETRTYQTVKWSSNGKTHTETMYVYQAANYELRDEYDTDTFAFSSINRTNRSIDAWYPKCQKTTLYSSGSTKSSTEDVTINSASLSSCVSSNDYEIKNLVIFTHGSNSISVTIPSNIGYYFGSAFVILECTCGQYDFQIQYEL